MTAKDWATFVACLMLILAPTALLFYALFR